MMQVWDGFTVFETGTPFVSPDPDDLFNNFYKGKTMNHLMKSVSLLVIALMLSSCSDEFTGSITPPDISSVSKDNLVVPGELSPEEAEGIILMRQEEKVARDVYTVLGQTWDLSIFENIAAAEQKHMDAVKRLIDRYSLEDPIVSDEIGVFSNPVFQQMFDDFTAQGQISVPEAFLAGQTIEQQEIAALENQLDFVDNTDLIQVYTKLKAASEKHYNAFLIHITPSSY